ncbi:hypothetical protein D0Z07_2577 [Hyphodiscus hymeniophilus]|uniref:Peptidase A1 domain-containing protein n=1 Tax=Hyphodiscus hymeniophilus TaxID=353542 RepID=A0A9P6VN63_9HELO|nr:hypothetical protein D0Z07_2577 [Hyphodiscus hymeniophilus]
MRTGTPPQVSSVLISTASNQPWYNPNSYLRLYLIQNNVTEQGIFALSIETNLNYSGNGLYGYDTVALSYLGSSVPSLDHQVVAGIATEDFYMGKHMLIWTFKVSSFNNPVQSYMAALKSQNLIPSLSYGYTAGNQYRFNKVLGSLTLGGYDAALIEPNELTIPLNSAGISDLQINIDTISLSSDNGTEKLSSSSFPAYIDSSVPYLYLPTTVCEKFEVAFGIVYDNVTELYLVNDTLHSQLLEQAANVTFKVTNVTGELFVDIVLPYEAFDLSVKYPLVSNATGSSRYFPLKRSQNSEQNTLGRAFLQEA